MWDKDFDGSKHKRNIILWVFYEMKICDICWNNLIYEILIDLDIFRTMDVGNHYNTQYTSQDFSKSPDNFSNIHNLANPDIETGNNE